MVVKEDEELEVLSNIKLKNYREKGHRVRSKDRNDNCRGGDFLDE